MAPVLTGKQIRAGLGWTNLTIDKLASKCGLNEKTIRRWTQDDGPIKAHQSNIDTVVDFFETRGCDVMSFGAKSSTVASVHLPPEMLDRLSKRYLNVKTLGEAARESRDYNVIVANLLKVSPRIATIYRQDDQLFFQSIKGDIPWASEQHSGTRVVDFPDPPLIQSISERNWRALLTGEPSFCFVTYDDLSWIALTVPTRRAGRTTGPFELTVTTAMRGIPDLL